MSTTCTECGRAFKGRSDAKTCSDPCRTQRSKRLKKEAILEQQIKEEREQSIQSIRKEIEKIEKENSALLVQFEQLQKNKVTYQVNIRDLDNQFHKNQNQKSNLTRQLKMDDYDFYNRFLNRNANYQLSKYYGKTYHSYNRQKVALQKVKDEKKKIETTISLFDITNSQNRQEVLKVEDQLAIIDPELKRIQQNIEFNQQRIFKFEKYLCNALLDGINTPINGKRKNGHIPAMKETLKGSELMMMDFETFTLPSELGRFLGQLERYRLAIALTGDSGAGKTYFSFSLVELFLNSGHSVKYYSLEMGLGNKVKELVQLYNCHDIALTQTGKITQVQKDAKVYDVIIVDSFGKLGANSKEFDKLRNTFPHTIFIFIFQKTNAGNMRGGSSIKFDSSMNIDVILREGKRIAVMEKSRYGTIGWEYDISEKKLNKEN